ncbi:hypothetical protein Hte_010053 [Hypoxylon texense]
MANLQLLKTSHVLPTPISRQNMDSPSSPNQGTALLNLPLEVLYTIGDYLTPAQRALFSQTCRSLFIGLERHSNASHLPRVDYLEYLAGRARDLPEQWVCEECMALHPTVEADTPAAKDFTSSCPVKPAAYQRCLPVLDPTRRIDTRLMWDQIRIEHHHIQLALKYTRLEQQKYNTYLQALLAPHHDKNYRPRSLYGLQKHYSAYPKVVAKDGGNFGFLLFSTWKYHWDHKGVSLYRLGRQMICPHLELFFLSKNITLHSASQHPPSPLRNLETAILEAFSALSSGADSGERTGACSFCATDFSVRLTAEYIELHAWQDFGSEGSPLDPAWVSHCFPGVTTTAFRPRRPTLYHEPGHIRSLYGPEVPGELTERNNAPVPRR